MTTQKDTTAAAVVVNLNDLYNDDHQATYCPEDNKIRLYIGYIPREEFLFLRAQGWKATPKQSENGGGEFAASWSIARENTARAYAGILLDEDQSPQARAADRAERFGEYRNKRTAEAVGHADHYDATPSAHGFQSQKKAEASAARHDRKASHALTAWDKAEYWTRRTAGVISNSLYKSRPPRTDNRPRNPPIFPQLSPPRHCFLFRQGGNQAKRPYSLAPFKPTDHKKINRFKLF